MNLTVVDGIFIGVIFALFCIGTAANIYVKLTEPKGENDERRYNSK